MAVSRRELVVQAIEFGSPRRVPVVFWNCDQSEGDVMLYHLALARRAMERRIPGTGRRTSGAIAWSEAVTAPWATRPAPLYAEMPSAGAIRVPPLREAERMSAVPEFLETCERPLSPGQLRPERFHRLHAAPRVRKRHGGPARGPGRIRRSHGRDHRLRVRPDAPGRALRLSRDPFRR